MFAGLGEMYSIVRLVPKQSHISKPQYLSVFTVEEVILQTRNTSIPVCRNNSHPSKNEKQRALGQYKHEIFESESPGLLQKPTRSTVDSESARRRHPLMTVGLCKVEDISHCHFTETGQSVSILISPARRCMQHCIHTKTDVSRVY